MNKLVNSPHNLAATPPLDLLLYAQLNDSSPLTSSAGLLPGEGVVPTRDYLDRLPADRDISVEAPILTGGVYTGAEWAKISAERIRQFLTMYHAARTTTT